MKMRESLWPAYNPLGALYNPGSIRIILERILFNDYYPDYAHVEYGGLHHNMLLDSHFSGHTENEVRGNYTEVRNLIRKKFEEGADIIVTFGTAFCYHMRNEERMNNAGFQYGELQQYIVGNCHKLPYSDFERVRFNSYEIASVWNRLVRKITKLYPKTRFIFTISPIRHLKDGLKDNFLSKSVLRLGIEELMMKLATDFTSDRAVCDNVYFPAYEILNDDLRDYRFYASDMVHPSELAVDYIYEKFQETFISERDRELSRRGLQITKGLRHRSIIPMPEVEEERKSNIMNKYLSLKEEWPECLDPQEVI